MANSSRDKWNTIYAKNAEIGPPAAVLLENVNKLPASGCAVDIACGNGANALFLAELGLETYAWDISDVAIEQLSRRSLVQSGQLPLKTEVVDIEASSFQGHKFDVIVSCHFLDRSITKNMLAALSPGGVIFFQTFMRERLIQTGPSNPDFLLEKGELIEMMQGLDVLAHRDGSMITDAGDPLAGKAYIVARKP